MNIWGKFFFTFSTIVIAILIGFLILLRNIPSDAVIAFLGVLFGGLISGFIQYSMSEANRKQNLNSPHSINVFKPLKMHTHYGCIFGVFRVLMNLMMVHWLKIIYASAETSGKLILYSLQQNARKAFQKALLAAINLASYRISHVDWMDLEKTYTDTEQAGRIIEESVFLPSLGELESNHLDKRPH